jgi:hypothetical protein
VSDGRDCRHEEWKTKHDTPFRAKLRQRTIRESLLALQRFDQCVRKVQILFQRKPTGANRLSGTDETDKVQVEKYFALQNRRCWFCTQSRVDSPGCDILMGLCPPRGYFQPYVSRCPPYTGRA